MIPFLTELFEFLTAALLMAVAAPVFKKPYNVANSYVSIGGVN